MAAEKTTMKVNIVAADHPVWHGDERDHSRL